MCPRTWKWDAYPFIFLTLMLSLQASYAAPLILLAQNRQEVRDKVVAEQDRQANGRAHADMEFLAREVASLRMAMGEVATRDYLRSELRALLAELEESRERERPAGARSRDPLPSPGNLAPPTRVGAHGNTHSRAGSSGDLGRARDRPGPRDPSSDHRARDGRVDRASPTAAWSP